MARANRHYLPGYVWHITHRCHKQEFLLKFAKDRDRLMYWLLQARKRCGVSILNYTITSNHIHVMVSDDGEEGSIPAAIQLVAGRTGQEYNRRKRRKGAFWEDRYHATAIESGRHLIRCLTYIDLNMVRAGVVKHPREWLHGGFHELQGTRQRKLIVELERLMKAVEVSSVEGLRREHGRWIEEALEKEEQGREAFWAESIAVGSEAYVVETKKKLGYRGKAREVEAEQGMTVLREPAASYGAHFGVKKSDYGPGNAYSWDE